ncbi:MAG: KOW domain-containing RNA-binding protein [Ethanoligenens sp.]
MEIETGTVVLALAGHDKGGYFAVIDFADDSHALIADGKRRKVEKLKRKKCKHLQAVGRLTLPDISKATNRQIRKALGAFGADAAAVSGGGI